MQMGAPIFGAYMLRIEKKELIFPLDELFL
jgi:hypothetical protein